MNSAINLYSIISGKFENPFKNRWYAVASVKELPKDRPYGIELFNTALVIFFDAKKRKWACLEDKCHHRHASLSCGGVSDDGCITCCYHGWRYSSDGRCVHIPSVPKLRQDITIKLKAFQTCVKHRILWVFCSESTGDESSIPHIPYDDKMEATIFARDTQFDWIIYNEHNIDMEHVQFSHPVTLKRNPKPIGDIRIIKSWKDSAFDGFHYQQKVELPSKAIIDIDVSWQAPSTTYTEGSHFGYNKVGGIVFITTPLCFGKCRVFFIFYRNFFLPVPQHIFHIRFSRVTEEDAILVRSQMTQLANENLLPETAYRTVKADHPVTMYRKWLAEHNADFWQKELNKQMCGAPNVQARTVVSKNSNIYQQWKGNMHLASRSEQHFTICKTCQKAEKVYSYIFIINIIILMALTWLPLYGWWMVLIAIVALAIGGSALKMILTLRGYSF